MRMIGSLPEEQGARVFGDYLLTLGIDHVLDEGGEGWVIWIKDEDHLDRARGELAAYAQNPSDPKYRHAALEASAIRSRQARKEKRLRETYVDVRTSWARGVQGAHPLTFVLVAVCVVASVGLWFKRGLPVWQYLWFAPMLEQPWRFITPIFLHGNVLHLLFNMLWLVDLGGLIEQRKGTWRLGVLVGVAAILSNWAQYLWAGPAFLGMSGVVYALFGYVWMKSRYQPQEQMNLHENTVFIMMAWLVACMTGWLGPVANAAHVGGLV
ncbi:MAG: rhomboid family intramembrane serine protease, partial [Bacillota bacterium]